MRLLFIRTAGWISGAERHNIYLLSALTKVTNLDISFLTNLPDLVSILTKYKVNTGLIKYYTPEIGTIKGLIKSIIALPYYYYDIFNKFLKLKGKVPYDVILLESMTEKIYLTYILHFFKFKVIWIEHGPVYITNIALVIKYLHRFNSKFVDNILAVSASTRKDLILGGIPANKIKLFYIGIDTNYFTPLSRDEILRVKKKLGLNKGNKIVGFIGRICIEKGIDDFVNLASLISRKDSRIVFLIMGSKDPVFKFYFGKYENLKGKIIEIPFVEDVRPFLGSLDILFFPTKHKEGIPISVLESMAMKIPVLTYEQEWVKEVIQDGVNGYIVELNMNKLRLAEYVYKIIYHTDLVQLKVNMREAVISKFFIKNKAHNFLKLIK